MKLPSLAFIKRFFQYSIVGGSTYLLDLFLIYLFKTFLHFPDAFAVGLGFLIAVSINFLISYVWVFKGTTRSKVAGYFYFIGIALAGLVIAVSGTLLLKNLLSVDVYVARSIVAVLIGCFNFLVNSFFNFKITH